MPLINELFSSPFGIMSAIVLFLILVMAVFFAWLFIKKSSSPKQ